MAMKLLNSVLPLLLVCLLKSTSLAGIKSLTLAEMVHTADGAVYGEIVGSRTFRVDSLVDGPELYYTTLTLAGRTLADDRPITIDVLFRGGFVSATEGVFNSVAPLADDVRIGRRVVAFYQWTDDMGGGLSGNLLEGGRGGLYRTVDGPNGTAVLGRGPGFAVSANVRLEQLASSVRLLSSTKPAQR